MISTDISFHGVSLIEISKENKHTIGDRTWVCRTIYLYDRDDECVTFQIHSREDGPLVIKMLENREELGENEQEPY